MKLIVLTAIAALSTCACSGGDSGGSSGGSGGSSGGSGGSSGGSGGGGGVGLGPPCGDNPMATVSFDIDGGGHTAEHVDFTQTTFTAADQTGIYYKKSDVTAIQAYQGAPTGNFQDPHAELYFMGNQPKTEDLGTPTQGSLQFDHVLVHLFLTGESGNEDFTCCNETTPPTYSGTITVSSFGAVGEPIVGTFEGSLDGQVTDLGGVSATITNGSFSVTRCQDGL